MKIILSIIALFSVSKFAISKTLPPVQPPAELISTSSEFSEGTITQLSPQDIQAFLPWAQNAQKVLTKALEDIESMPIRMQVDHLNKVIQSVVRRSGQKSYQMFMRFALNRAMLLVQELTKEADLRESGILENALDIQVKAIRVALSVSESDLSYQRRVSDGNDTVKLEYAKFGLSFGRSMLEATNSVLDASAQYRLLYKTLEIINWDLSRDDAALEYADQIIDIYNTLTTMSENPGNDDIASIFAIRRLNRHVEELRKIQLSTDSTVITIRRGAAEMRVGNVVLDVTSTPVYGTITELRTSSVILKLEDNTYKEVLKTKIAYLTGCQKGHCVGDKAINIARDYNEVTIVGISQENKFVLLFKEGASKGKMGQNWDYTDIAAAKGCSGDICYGDAIFNLTRQVNAKVIGIQHDGKFVLLFTSGTLVGKKGGNWSRSDLTKMK